MQQSLLQDWKRNVRRTKLELNKAKSFKESTALVT